MSGISINERVRYALKYYNYNFANFSNGTEADRQRIGRQINGTTAITVSTIEKLLNTFPNLSAEWLLRGDAPMDKSENMAPRIYNSGSIGSLGNNKGTQTVSSPSDAVLQAQLDNMKSILTMKDELLALKDRQINDLTLDKHALQNQLSQLLIKLPKIQ